MKTKHQKAAVSREELLTQEEIAALLRVTVRTVERWQQEGVLPYLRMGHAIRFHWPAVLNHLIANFTLCKGRMLAPRTYTEGTRMGNSQQKTGGNRE